MRFGTVVDVHRGGGRVRGPGRGRVVRGVLIGAKGNDRIVRLLEDDPDDTVGWRKRGDVGRWGAEAVLPAAER